MQRWDLNPCPSEHESPSINTRPGLPPFLKQSYKEKWCDNMVSTSSVEILY